MTLRIQSETDENGLRLVVCDCCGYARRTHWPLHQIHHQCQIVTLVGDCLYVILRALQVKPHKDCNCDAMIGKMNAWGPDGCREHKPEILSHLQAAYDSSSLFTAVAAGLLAIYKHLPKTIEGLLDLAIERVESRSKLTIAELAEIRVKWEQTTLAKLASGPLPIDQLGCEYDQHWLANLVHSGQIAKITIDGQALYGLPETVT